MGTEEDRVQYVKAQVLQDSDREPLRVSAQEVRPTEADATIEVPVRLSAVSDPAVMYVSARIYPASTAPSIDRSRE